MLLAAPRCGARLTLRRRPPQDPLFKNHGRQDYEQKRRTPFNESVITGLVTESFGRARGSTRRRPPSAPSRRRAPPGHGPR